MTNQQLLALVKKNPIGVGCSVLCLLLVAGIYYRSGELPDAQVELDQKSAEGARLAANVKYSAQMKEQLEALVAAEKEIDRRLLHVGQTLTSYQYFYKLESETGVKLASLNQSTPAGTKLVGKASFMPLAFSVSVQGNLGQLLSFLRRLESGEHYCRTVSATLNTVASGTAPLTLTANLDLLGLP